MKDKPWR